jgi:molybdopterin/thiamine biosynthesis adenylyltransferase
MSGAAGSDLRRHARQVVLPEVGVAGQQALAASRVLIIGCGGLGSAASLYLAAAGVGTLHLMDRDRVEATNLQRQILYREADIGRLKAEAALATLGQLDSRLQLQAWPAAESAEQWRAAVQEVDLVLDCTDNFPSRFAINAACVTARKPLVSGAAIRWEGQVALFDTRQGSGCYACLYPDSGEVAEACEDAGVPGPVVGVIGSLQALLALQWLLGVREAAGWLHCWDARRNDWRKLRIRPDPDCPQCARR